MNAPSQARRIAVLGDSIAAGYGLPPAYAWPNLLIARLKAAHPQFDWRLHNASVPGEATPDAYVRFDVLRQQRPHLLLIALGINDCRRAYSPVVARRIAHFRRNERSWWGKNPILRRIGYRISPRDDDAPIPPAASQVALDDFLDILGWMVRQAQRMNALPALMTLSPLSPSLRESPDFAACPRYNTAIRDLARETGAALIETTAAMPDGSWQSDGVHLTALGQDQLAQRAFRHFHPPPIAPYLGLEVPASNAQMAPSLD